MRTKELLWTGAAVVVGLVGALAFSYYATAPHPAHLSDQTSLPGIMTTETPWSPETAHLLDRLKKLDLPALTQEGTALHIHQHLDIFVDGNVVDVPPKIGINESAGFISPIHTHDTTGVIHVESPTVQKFTLGQFFDIWGLQFSSQCIGRYCSNADRSLKVYVNGALYSGDPRDLVLVSHQEIAVIYGTATGTPKVISGTYSFPAGE
jgi:hypothetical protein